MRHITVCCYDATSIVCSTWVMLQLRQNHLFKVSKQLDEDYGNGKIYYDFDDKPINVPAQVANYRIRKGTGLA